MGIAEEAGDGAAIPLDDGSWLSENGQSVIVQSQLALLEKSIKSGGGVYSIIKDDESDWQKIVNEGILKVLPTDQTQAKEQWKEIYMWFLFPALLLFISALFPSLKLVLAFIVLSSLIAFSTLKADEVFLDHLYAGESGYEKKNFYQAKSAFVQSVLKANTSKERAIALHNLGNSLFQIGDYATASQLFMDALRYDPQQKQSAHNQKLSYELYKALSRRQRNQQMQGNLGAPNRNSLLQDLPDNINQNLNTQAVNTTEFKLPDLPKETLNRLLKKGLARIQLLQAEKEKNKDNVKKQQNIDEARLYLIGLEEQVSASSNPLWKRLFEIEEGFPGDLEEPEKIPGVKPW